MSKLIEKMYRDIAPERKRRFEYADQIAKYLYYLLEKKEMTQKELADKMKMKPSQLSRYMNGEANLNLETIARLEISLGERILNIKQGQRIQSGQTVTATIEQEKREGKKESRIYYLKSSKEASKGKTEKMSITRKTDTDINSFDETA